MTLTFEAAMAEITAAGAILKAFYQNDSRQWSIHVEFRIPGKVGRGHVQGCPDLPTAMREALANAESDAIKITEHWKTLEGPPALAPRKLAPVTGLSLASLGLVKP